MTAALSQRAAELGAADVIQKVYAAMGNQARATEAIRALTQLTAKLSREDWVVKAWAMNWYSQLGAIGEAYRTGDDLRMEFVEQSPTNAWSWLWSPEMRPFRLDPRFGDFTARLGMLDYWKKYGPPDDCALVNGHLVCH